MASIVELHQMSGDKLNELLENNREELFNLRFQKASAQLENTARLREVRREIAQVETVLHLRDLAVKAAAADSAVAAAIGGAEWKATARYVYEDSAWRVDFASKDGKNLATAMVNLNASYPKGRRARATKKAQQRVVSSEVRA